MSKAASGMRSPEKDHWTDGDNKKRFKEDSIVSYTSQTECKIYVAGLRGNDSMHQIG